VTAQQPGYKWDCVLTIMPECVIEIASANGSDHYLRDKAIYYRTQGCQLPILIDPLRHTVEVLTPTGFHQLSARDALDGGSVLPGFRVPVWRLFAP
jgi:Uma2 family endonuclease